MGGERSCQMIDLKRRKELGAYYTDQAVADFLARWAIHAPTERVLEPSFGGGAFLAAAAARLRQLGAETPAGIYGVELDPHVRSEIAAAAEENSVLDPGQLYSGDFFEFEPDRIPPVDAVVGNPPFVRYQRFAPAARRLALQRAAQRGVVLPELTSTWAPFILHASGFLRPGGRMAMVAPVELTYASYARPVLRYLVCSFAAVTLLSFERRLFPHLSEDTLLLLAEGYGMSPSRARMVSLRDALSLERLDLDELTGLGVPLDLREIDRGHVRIATYFLEPDLRHTYRELANSPGVMRLGDLAEVGIGYVTGDNDFFHLSRTEGERLNLDAADLCPAVRRGRDLAVAGIALTLGDWERLTAAGGKHLLFLPREPLGSAARAYVEEGERRGVPRAYKCRVRKPWYRVPWVMRPDLILSVMAGRMPRLVANEVGVVVTNTLHAVRLRRGVSVSASVLAACAVNSLTLLSAEIEGHSLGGGVLKFEPSEAARLLMPVGRTGEPPPDPDTDALIDRRLREGQVEAAIALGDQIFLGERLGLTDDQIDQIRRALSTLRDRRQNR